MKKIIALLLTFLFIFTICGCNSNKLTAKTLNGRWETEITALAYSLISDDDLNFSLIIVLHFNKADFKIRFSILSEVNYLIILKSKLFNAFVIFIGIVGSCISDSNISEVIEIFLSL